MAALSLRLNDFVTLVKPRIILLLTITCVCGALVAVKGNLNLLWHSLPLIGWGTLGLILSASGANSVNMWYDRDIDPLMKRTQNRPIPAGRLQPCTVLIYGISLILLGTLCAAMANVLAAAMALSGALFYVFIYTMLLKRHTVQNIVIGGAAGAFPPLVGWAAVQNDITSPLPWLMFAIIFLWTPPHFWALALMANADYTRAHIPMYPVVHGEPATRLAIVRYLTILIPATLLGGLFAPLGWLYTAAAIGLGAWWFMSAWTLLHSPQLTSENRKPAQIVFTRSLSYLAFLFLAMVIDSFL
ncbi:MAG: protoheme IX farnesyltransferase [Blastochloris viridis]|uniref:Protoheme IX farnesyltransferase n=1 Tax=Blastochloris viridis TaxID=1079 RepID=A0A6N4R311_BLAVI|nr:MAG: protoheme IX farnesyltransferase [Blastochloris viridis]